VAAQARARRSSEAARWHEPYRYTYTELLEEVHRIANAFLRRFGVGRGDAVALTAPL
jgi:acyl-coenzyme A synthetase/AMP-(fatty) acid ligase